MPKSIINKKDKIINQLISEKLPNYSVEQKQLARQQLEEFIDIASSIIIKRSESCEMTKRSDAIS